MKRLTTPFEYDGAMNPSPEKAGVAFDSVPGHHFFNNLRHPGPQFHSNSIAHLLCSQGMA